MMILTFNPLSKPHDPSATAGAAHIAEMKPPSFTCFLTIASNTSESLRAIDPGIPPLKPTPTTKSNPVRKGY